MIKGLTFKKLLIMLSILLGILIYNGSLKNSGSTIFKSKKLEIHNNQIYLDDVVRLKKNNNPYSMIITTTYSQDNKSVDFPHDPLLISIIVDEKTELTMKSVTSTGTTYTRLGGGGGYSYIGPIRITKETDYIVKTQIDFIPAYKDKYKIAKLHYELKGNIKEALIPDIVCYLGIFIIIVLYFRKKFIKKHIPELSAQPSASN
jgi:hypothetical protein